jgi:hypothetical protein
MHYSGANILLVPFYEASFHLSPELIMLGIKVKSYGKDTVAFLQ